MQDKETLADAWLSLNEGKWPESLGAKPEGFNENRDEYIFAAMEGIESIIGAAEISRRHWMKVLGRSEEEWFRWYITERTFRRQMVLSGKLRMNERKQCIQERPKWLGKKRSGKG